LPPETVPKFNKEVAQFFFKKALKEKDNEKLQMFCIDKAISFVTEEAHLKLAASWIHENTIKIDGEELKCELTNEHKYAIVKSYYASPHFSLDEKKALKAKTFETDDSDNAKNVQKVCDWSLPEPALKEKLWAEITDFESKDSLMDIRLKIQGFWQRKQQLDLMTPYFEKYYAIIASTIDKRDREFGEVFMNNLSPAFMAREQDEKAFQALLDNTSEPTHFFTLFLKKALETIDVTKKSRKLCETYKVD